jgi:hypothetical protein
VQTAPGYGEALDDITYTAADASNNMDFQHPGGMVAVILKNKHSGSQVAQLVTVANRRTFNEAGTKDLTAAAGSSADKECIAVLPAPGRGGEAFIQSDGKVHIDIADDTALSIAVVALTQT